jgi:hypothetical protein
MNSPHDEGSPAQRRGEFPTWQREEIPEVKSFPKTDLSGKPLAAFEVAPAYLALPSTWGAHDSRSAVHVPETRAEAS